MKMKANTAIVFIIFLLLSCCFTSSNDLTSLENDRVAWFTNYELL